MQQLDTRGREDAATQRAGDAPWLPILMYHQVPERVEDGDPYNLCVPVSEFEAQMCFLKDRGYQTVPLSQAAAMVARGERPGRKQVVITFDDGYRDVYTNAFPILQRYGMTADVMLVSGRIGESSLWDRDKVEPAPLLGRAEIAEMQAYGVTFGSHGVTHHPLTGMPREEARQEIAASKASLEDMLGCEVSTFSFPHGKSDPALREMVREAGYIAACGIEQREHALLNLSRIDVAASRGSMLLWRLKLWGVVHRFRRSPARRAIRGLVRARPAAN